MDSNKNGYSSIMSILFYSILIIFSVISIFKMGLLTYAYLQSDEATCNLLWCEFKTARISYQHYMTSSSECYINGVKINCSDFPTQDYEHFYNNGNFEMNGVCPYPNSNMTIEDCIKRIEK